MSDQLQCSICHKVKRTVTLQPSISQLIFGGFTPRPLQPRCAACDRKLGDDLLRWLDRMIEDNLMLKQETLARNHLRDIIAVKWESWSNAMKYFANTMLEITHEFNDPIRSEDPRQFTQYW